MPDSIDNASVKLKANIYFNEKVVSHTLVKDGKKQTVGIIYPGSYKWNPPGSPGLEAEGFLST